MGLKPPMLFAKCQAFHLRRAFELQQRTCPRCHNVASQCMGSVESNDMEFLGAFNFATIGDVYGFGPCLSRLQSPLDVPKGLLAHQLFEWDRSNFLASCHGSLVRRCLALVWRNKKHPISREFFALARSGSCWKNARTRASHRGFARIA